MNNATEEIFNILDQMFDLPNHIVNLNLNLTLDKAPTLEVEYIVDVPYPVSHIKKFEILEREHETNQI